MAVRTVLRYEVTKDTARKTMQIGASQDRRHKSTDTECSDTGSSNCHEVTP